MSHTALPMLVSAVLLAASTGCAPGPIQGQTDTVSAGARPCFTPSQVHNFRSAGPTALYLRVRVSEVYELETTPCPGSDFANTLAILPDGPSDQLCVGDRARLRTRGAGTTDLTCTARVVRKLTPEQAAALPVSAQP